MTKDEVVHEVARYVAAYEIVAHKRGSTNEREAAGLAKMVARLVTQFTEEVDASLRTGNTPPTKKG